MRAVRPLSKYSLFIKYFAIVTGLLLSSTLGSISETSLPARVDIAFENWQMSLLSEVKNRPGVTIRPFSTDGCSGGLSGGWRYMADVLPSFSQKFGDKPPWEACCVEHDRAYWQGVTDNGYELRMMADQALRRCVSEYGREHSESYAGRFSLDRDVVEQHFSTAAGLMYNAVRLGGKPCSLLPWRWGYGWPHCIPGSR